MNNNQDFVDKIVIVTGSSSGIGEDAVISFTRAGAQAVVTGRNESRVKAVADKCKAASPTGLSPLVVIGDVSNESDCIKIIQSTIDAFGRIDVLVNNAAIVIPTNLASETDVLMSNYDSIFRTNVRSVLLLTKLAAPHLVNTRGVIVNVSSIVSKVGATLSTPYSMSKAAIDSLTKCAAVELGPKGVRVVSVNPAAIQTPIFEGAGLTPEIVEIMKKAYPVRRIGSTPETSAAILFAASPGASFVTGSSIFVDGGLLATASGSGSEVNE